MRKGVLSAAFAYVMWGFFPIYFKFLKPVPAIEILCHRMTWSLVFLSGILTITRQWDWLVPALKNGRTVFLYFCAASLLAINWFTYIWAVNSSFIIESSLGYFINPLVSILIGVLILRERLRPIQWVPVGLAASGIIYITWLYGRLPWIALTLAVSFGFYGLIKKISPLPSLKGLTMETGLLFFPALSYLIYLEVKGSASFAHTSYGTTLLLALAGVITAVPLLLFTSGVRRIPLYLSGLLQYITPTMQLLIGIFIYEETFSSYQFIGFSLIWLALGIYTIEALIHLRKGSV